MTALDGDTDLATAHPTPGGDVGLGVEILDGVADVDVRVGAHDGADWFDRCHRLRSLAQRQGRLLDQTPVNHRFLRSAAEVAGAEADTDTSPSTEYRALAIDAGGERLWRR